jgi:hypothetical protein
MKSREKEEKKFAPDKKQKINHISYFLYLLFLMLYFKFAARQKKDNLFYNYTA